MCDDEIPHGVSALLRKGRIRGDTLGHQAETDRRIVRLASPMAEYFPAFDVAVGNELFRYIFDGEPTAENGFLQLREDVPGLGLSLSATYLDQFQITE